MKRVLAALLLLALAATANASGLNQIPFPILGSANTNIQEFGPNGANTTKLTVSNKTINLANYVLFDIVVPAALTTCQLRLSATAPIGNYGTNTATVFPAGAAFRRSVNTSSTFANLSGCTNAYLEIQ